MNGAPSKRELFRYAFLAFPLSFAGLPLYLHVPDFYARHLGVSLGLLGSILLGVRLFDAVQDPLIGYLSDRARECRRWILLAGLAALVTGIGGLFYGYGFIGLPAWATFMAYMLLATTGYSAVSINLTMLGGFWREGKNERAAISAWREGFAIAGLLLASALPSLFQGFFPPAIAFQLFFPVLAVLTVAAAFFFFPLLPSIDRGDRPPAGSGSGFAFFSILGGKAGRFFAICFLSHLAAALPAVLVLFFIRDYLGEEPLSGLFLVLYFVSGAAFVGAWAKLAAKIGMNGAWLASMLLSVFAFVWALALNPGDAWAYGVVCCLSGIAFGADLALPPAMLAELVNENREEHRATQYYAALAFLPKAALAMASGLSLTALDGLGFVAGGQNDGEALRGLLYAYALVPCGIKMLAALLLRLTLFNKRSR